jgi:hypothetical protein
MRSKPFPALALALVSIATGLTAVALLGPLTDGPIAYHVSDTLRSQTIGLDATGLIVVAPLALAAALLARRGHPAGPVLALGIGAYTAYMLIQYVVGPAYLARPGNNELLFPLYLVLFALGWGTVVIAWRTLGAEPLQHGRRRDQLLGKAILPVVAFLAFARYVPALVDAMSAEPHDAGYLAGPTFFWTIAMLDLGVFLPATVVTCVGLVRARAWAKRALYLVVGWFGLVGPAVAAMAVAMYVNDAPHASAGDAAVMTVLGVAFAALAVVVYLPVLTLRGAAPTGAARVNDPHSRASEVLG